MKIQWAKIISVTFILALLLHLALITGLIEEMSGAEGFAGGFVVMSWMMLLYPLVILGASFFVAFIVKEERIRHFFLTLIVAITINLFMFSLLSVYSGVKDTKVTHEMYQNDPQSRPVLDAQRPLSIVEPLVVKKNATSPINIVVHALPGVLESGKSKVEIKDDVYPPEAKPWGEGLLHSDGELGQDGRIIYKATVSFEPNNGWSEGVIIVKGKNGEIATSNIRP